MSRRKDEQKTFGEWVCVENMFNKVLYYLLHTWWDYCVTEFQALYMITLLEKSTII